MRPSVPSAKAPRNNPDQLAVTIRPVGKMPRVVPGNTKPDALVFASVASAELSAASIAVCDMVEKTPVGKKVMSAAVRLVVTSC